MAPIVNFQDEQKLIKKKDNGRVKIITGIRRCGKSYLLFEIYTRYLRENGVAAHQIIGLALDEVINAKYRNPIELDKFIRKKIQDKSKKHYILIDEIQFAAEIQNPYVDDPSSKITFIDVVLGLMKIRNAFRNVSLRNAFISPAFWKSSTDWA